MTVEYLQTVTTLDLDPNRVLEAAVSKLKSVVIVGYDNEGDEYFASSVSDGAEVLWLLERAKHKLLQITKDDIE